jgi:hypothetical protein
MGSQVPSPIHVSGESQQERQSLQTIELLETIKTWISIIEVGSGLFYAKVCTGHGIKSWV